MNDLAQDLQQTVEKAVEHLLTIPESQTQIFQGAQEWTAKEILGDYIGHLKAHLRQIDDLVAWLGTT